MDTVIKCNVTLVTGGNCKKRNQEGFCEERVIKVNENGQCQNIIDNFDDVLRTAMSNANVIQ